MIGVVNYGVCCFSATLVAGWFPCCLCLVVCLLGLDLFVACVCPLFIWLLSVVSVGVVFALFGVLLLSLGCCYYVVLFFI